MISIIFAGGAGSRLWPLSTNERPKQFLNLLHQQESLLQQTYRRLEPVSQAIYVVANKNHESHIRQNLPDLPLEQIVLEPSAKGTTAALLLALRGLQDQPKTPLFISWADHYISDVDQFQMTVKAAQEFLETEASLVQLGVQPTYPASHFGYLKVGDHIKDNIYQLAQFLEKPEPDLAKQFFESGNYLWNSGYFMTTFDFIRSQLKKINPDRHRDLIGICQASEADLESVFLSCRPGNMDSDLNERLQGAYLIDCNFSFTDIGNFKDLHGILDKDGQGNTTVGKLLSRKVSNSYLINQTGRQLAVAGLDNLVVIVTKDRILVANKDNIEDIGWLAKDMEGAG